MTETVLEIRIPSLLLQHGLSRDEVERRVNQWLILSLFTEERISSGKAATLLGMSRIEFLALLRQNGIAYINLSEDELNEEFAAADALPSPHGQ